MAGSLMQSAITSAFEQMRSFRLAGTSGTPRSNCRTHSMAHAHNTRRNISGLGDAAAHTYLLRDIAVCMQGWLGAGLGPVGHPGAVSCDAPTFLLTCCPCRPCKQDSSEPTTLDQHPTAGTWNGSETPTYLAACEAQTNRECAERPSFWRASRNRVLSSKSTGAPVSWSTALTLVSRGPTNGNATSIFSYPACRTGMIDMAPHNLHEMPGKIGSAGAPSRAGVEAARSRLSWTDGRSVSIEGGLLRL